MFCAKCGKTLPEGVKFCDGCGAPTGAAPAQVPVQPTPAVNPYADVNPVNQAPNPMMPNFMGALQGFFKNPTRTVVNATKSTSMEWLLFFGCTVFVYMFALALNGVGTGFLTFGQGILDGLMFGVASFFLMAIALFLGVKVAFNKDVNIQSVFNTVAVASIPLVCVYIVNIPFGFIWMPFIALFSAAGLLATAVLLYEGFKAFADDDKDSFLPYVLCWLAVMIVVGIVAFLIVKGQMQANLMKAFKSLF